VSFVAELSRKPPLDFIRRSHPSIDDAGGSCWQKLGDELSVIVSESIERDGRVWLHVSMSRPTRLPTWSDMRRVKDAFIGKERKAIQVFPPDSEYVNQHPYCLHLFCCLDGDVLPDFRRGDGL
jgi:hypothetical protein